MTVVAVRERRSYVLFPLPGYTLMCGRDTLFSPLHPLTRSEGNTQTIQLLYTSTAFSASTHFSPLSLPLHTPFLSDGWIDFQWKKNFMGERADSWRSKSFIHSLFSMYLFSCKEFFLCHSYDPPHDPSHVPVHARISLASLQAL